MEDIYFKEDYARLYEPIEPGKAERFVFSGEKGRVSSLFLKREILLPGENGEPSPSGWYDIVSPYGYGGPVIEEVRGEREALAEEFAAAFGTYCRENRIVSEFIRFHPVLGNALDFKKVYPVTYSRHTLGTDLTLEDPLAEEFSKSCRKNIRRALNKGVTYKVTYQPESLDCFKEIYFDTMDRNKASDYYYFDDRYFDTCLEKLRSDIVTVEAVFEGKIIAMNLCFVSDNTIHIHLSGTRHEYLYLSPAYILRYALMLWGKEQGLKMIHHGGGRSGREDDDLYLFKKQFGQKTAFDFYFAKKIWDEEAYDHICRILHKDRNVEFFPAYRA